jgi:hypothetical protein
MRFDNPIYDHGFKFPDIAEFPDVADEPRYNGNNAEEYLAKMRSAIENKNQEEFSNGYKHFMKKPDSKLKKLDYQPIKFMMNYLKMASHTFILIQMI